MSGRGPAWFFLPEKQLVKLAAGVPKFQDTSHIAAFCDVDGAKPPWTPETALAAAQAVHDAAEDDDRLQDGLEYRFFVGGVACKGVEVYRKLVAAASTCSAYCTAVLSSPSEHGAAPWNSLDVEARSRNGGILKGPAVPIVGASRDPTFSAAATAAIKVFECGARGPTAAELQELLELNAAAGPRTPLDVKKLEASLAARMVEDAHSRARELGPGTEDVAGLARALADGSVWQKRVNAEWHPLLVSDDGLGDIQAMLDAVKLHHPEPWGAALKASESSLATGGEAGRKL